MTIMIKKHTHTHTFFVYFQYIPLFPESVAARETAEFHLELSFFFFFFWPFYLPKHGFGFCSMDILSARLLM